MILEAVIIILGVIVVAFIISHFENKLTKERAKISLKESMDLAQIPIVTFQEGTNKLNFLLDSGSSESHISKEASKMLIGTPIDTDYSFVTSIGEGTTCKMVEAVLGYKTKEFKIDLFINEGLDASFAEIKNNCGIQLHGILGSDFLKKYKYVLDFAELVAYHK